MFMDLCYTPVQVWPFICVCMKNLGDQWQTKQPCFHMPRN